MSLTAFRIVVALSGLFVIVLGLNVALGGMATAGWLGERPFFTVTDEEQYGLLDSHIRFFGGFFAAAGFFLLIAASNPLHYAQGLYLVFATIFAGGIARFSLFDAGIFTNPDVFWALAAELVLMQVLAFWLSRLRR
ncbi:DUF4345 family protein [Parvibaculum sp.]|uniref:DUF4345 family protein n=1 Tax=Parvibaculum sp. TaxID=2024848 RepID=UPI001B1FDAE3|nr:DUF4345 family protein [Parvibaculum sp.]MBO6633089.1 DUF4345 family protein [Parvibaculum sp.]MBO6677403.1 DUF4345 family protein [Parvibaculum sp.]MBO6684530.1 DUF4345 family protein [Parvibaculum sp.]MBO6903910.1 DUF4345 family protein [Parvibaculum sp.]